MFRRVVFVLAACLLLTACRVDSTITVDVHDNGSGVVAVAVSFDADAASRVPDLAGQLRLADLHDAGWTVTGPARQLDGTTLVRAEKSFASPDQLPGVLREVTGPDGALRDIRLSSRRTFGKARWGFTGTVDLRKGVAAFSDAQIAALLNGQPLGRDPTALEQQTGTSIAAATSLTLEVSLPGAATGNAPVIAGRSGRWVFHLDQSGPHALALTSTATTRAAWIWGAVALAAAVLLVLLLLGRVARGGRRRTRGGAAPDAATPAPAPAAVPARRLELVVLDGPGVIFATADPVADLLVPFVTERGGVADAERVGACYRAACEGKVRSAALWAELGVAGDPAELDRAFTARYQLAPDVVEFVATMAQRGVGVACVTDGVAEWSAALRDQLGLDTRVRPWIVSGEAGVCKPDGRLFEQLLARAAVPARNCLYLDTRIANLDAARALGMATVRLGPQPYAGKTPHRHAGSLAELTARRP